jgi:hypothetical protein
MSSQALIVLAYRYASAEKVGPFIYSVIVFTALVDWIVWDHPPTLFVYLGMALVIGGASSPSAQNPSRSTLSSTPSSGCADPSFHSVKRPTNTISGQATTTPPPSSATTAPPSLGRAATTPRR